MAVTVLGAVTLLGLAACSKDQNGNLSPEPEPVCGGRTEHTDETAPKQITSREITGFHTNLFLATRKNVEEGNLFEFEIREDGQGQMIACEKQLQMEHVADEELLTGLLDVIDTYHLASFNGIYDVTAGLPPEYQERFFTVDYASGEKLSFTEDNDPYSRWETAIYDLFAKWFSDRGDDRLYPAKETSKINRLYFWYGEEGMEREYMGIEALAEDAIDGETYLLRKSSEGGEEAYIRFPDDYYDRVTEIVAGTNLVRAYDFSEYDFEEGNFGNHDKGYYGMGSADTSSGEEDAQDQWFELHLTFDSGKRMHIETKKSSEIEGMKQIIAELMEYHESLFAERETAEGDSQ